MQTIIKPRDSESIDDFPLYAISGSTNSLVLFSAKNRGVFIRLGDNNFNYVGQEVSDLPSCYYKAHWSILPKGTVITTTI